MSAPASTSSRRAFLAAVAATAAACKVARHPSAPPSPARLRPVPDRPEAPAPDGITEQTFAEAEKLAGVRYTPAERRQMLDSVEDHLARIAARRSHRLPPDLAPATVFDPRLPGRPLPTATARVRGTSPSPAKPGSDEDIAFAPIPVLGRWLRRKVVTSARVTEIHLERLHTLGGRLGCVVTPTDDLAREQAAKADQELARGRDRGPLHGIPWGAKDLLDTAGIPTTWGATPYTGRVPERDAVVVQRLADAGAVLAAKLTTGALAYGDIWFGGRTLNPWNLDEGSSGSSAGPAAAVAAGLVTFALGTETLGSIVAPSMRCGTTGLRPTFGRVARTGCMSLCWSLDKIGPITRRVEDAALVLAAIDGPDPGDPASFAAALSFDARAKLSRMRVGYVPAWLEADDATDVDRRALATLDDLGVERVAVELPQLPYDALLAILLVEAATAFEELTLDGQDDALVWQGDEAWPNTFRLARFVSGIDYLAAQRLRREVMEGFAGVLDDVDALCGPSFADSMLLATNCTGHPSLTLPAGFVERAPIPDVDGWTVAGAPAREVPQGITLWGRLGDEGRLCRLGMALEEKLGVADRRPPVL